MAARLGPSALTPASLVSGCSPGSGGSGSGVGVPVSDLPAIRGGGADRIDAVAEAAARGVHTRVKTELFVRDERVSDPTCVLDANGALLVPADTFHRRLESSLVLVDGRWLVSDLRSTGARRCDP